MITLGKYVLTAYDIKKIACSEEKIALSSEAMQKVSSMYELIKKQALGDKVIYGLNTGFGALAEQKISALDQETLQYNIIVSHAVGVQEPLSIEAARALMLLRLNTLIRGYSGASPKLLSMLATLLNNNCAPYVPRAGSVGASGDLAPLAHMGLLLLGIGPAYYNHKIEDAHIILKLLGLEKLKLGLRDGLALINGTQAMTALGALALLECEKLADLADINAASTLDALAGHAAPFDERIQLLKPHPGQISVAQNIRTLIKDRVVDKYTKNLLTQDPYSLRCVPQVHGASRDVLSHAWEVIMREINSVTDNPLIFISDHEELISLSGGNFHGQALALILDYLAMAIAELGSIAERRIELLLNPHSSQGLPPFLAAQSGLNSGYMMLHVTASALVSENKVLCHPASVDSIPTSANREDHVSMGMTAANKLMRVIENTKTVLAIELLASHQALDFRTPKTAGLGVQQVHKSIRSSVAFREGDGLYIKDLQQALSWINNTDLKNYFDRKITRPLDKS